MGIALTKRAIGLGVVTTNGDAMLKFYRDTLGLTYLREMKMPGGGLMHQLSCGDTVIKLVIVETLPAKSPPGGIRGANGNRYWTISVSNITELLASCVEAGAKLAVKETEIRPGVRIGLVEDPDGNWVEFLQVAQA
ncbi:MAG TPA: VOC family protein [Steroidobacteraceae bacterium]|nr:VOC family protein [Steroidobacteraceae bacterium]